jgi:hypothetical protein
LQLALCGFSASCPGLRNEDLIAIIFWHSGKRMDP